MAAPAKLTLADLQKGLAKTPERANYGTIAGRALSGIDPRYLGGFDPLQYQTTFNSLYDQLAAEFTAQDMGLNQLYNDYETGWGRLGDDEAEANRKLINAMANRGTLSSGAFLDESENVAGDFNRARSDLGSSLQKGFTDAAGRRLQAIAGYNTGLAQQELGLGQSAKGYAQSMIQAEAEQERQRVLQEQQAAQNEAMMAQMRAAQDAQLEAMRYQYEEDARSRSYVEPAPVYYPPPSLPQVMQTPQQQYAFQGSEPPYIPPPAYGQPGYQPILKSNPAKAPNTPGGSFVGGGGTVANMGGGKKTGIPISPGYGFNVPNRGVNPYALGKNIAV